MKYSKSLPIEALNNYNKALSFLPEKVKKGESNLLPLLLANRSLVLHQLGHHKPALLDIRRSLEAGYPERSVYKLYTRQASIFSSLGQREVVERCLERARDKASLLEEGEREVAERIIRDKAGEMTGADRRVEQTVIISR